MVAVDFVGGEDDRSISRSSAWRTIVSARLPKRISWRTLTPASPEALLQGEELGRGPGLQAAVEVGHLLEVDVLDGLDDVQQLTSPRCSGSGCGDLHGRPSNAASFLSVKSTGTRIFRNMKRPPGSMLQ